MKILLLNKNPIISKLVKLSAEKIGYDFEEKEKYKKGLKADIIIVDSEIELDLKELSSECLKLIYLSAKKDEKKDADGFISISKPFLPTDLLELIQEKETQAIDTEEKVSEDKNPYDDMNIDLDNLNFQIDETKEDKTEEVKEENKDKEEPKEDEEDEFLEENLDFGGIDETQDKEQKDQVIDDEKNENFDEHDLDEALKLSEEEKNEKIDEYIDKDEDLSLDFKDTQDEQEQKYIFGTEEELQTQTDTIDIKDDEIKVDEDELNINEDLKDLKPEEKHETLKDGEESSKNTELKDEFLHEDFLSLEQNLDTNKEEEIKDFSYPVVIMPVNGYGSRGIYIVDSIEEIRKLFDRVAQYSTYPDDILVESYNDGLEFNMMNWMADGEVYTLSLADREKSVESKGDIPHVSRVCYPSRVIDAVYEEARKIIKKVADYTGIQTGPLSMQFFYKAHVVFYHNAYQFREWCFGRIPS